VQLAHPASDQLCVLGPEVDHEHCVAIGVSGGVIGGGLRLTQGMYRRGTVRIGTALVAAGAAFLFLLLGSAVLASPHSFALATPAPPVTISDFYPEDNNLSDCVGLVERPGCGSEERGGWRQAAVFVVLAAGLALIIWRISVGVRRNRSDQPDDGQPDTDRTPDSDSSRG
jgi:hypothetical protein